MEIGDDVAIHVPMTPGKIVGRTYGGRTILYDIAVPALPGAVKGTIMYSIPESWLTPGFPASPGTDPEV